MQATFPRAAAAVWIPVLAMLFTAFLEPAIAQSPFQCSANAGVATPARFEGLAEPVGDFVITCTGGAPTTAGSPIRTVNFTVFLNTSVTSRNLASGRSEALLLMDEPIPSTQRVCGTPGDAEAGGVCTITGTGTGSGDFNGTPGRPNVFQGIQNGNSVTFFGIPIDPPGGGASRVIRIVNIRANAHALGLGVPGSPPTPIMASLSVSGSLSLPVVNPLQTVAFVAQGLTSSVSGSPRFSQCVSQNASLAGNPSQSGVSQFSVSLGENFATAFKRRNVATTSSIPTTLANQNDLRVGTYNTETGFFNSSFPAIAGQGNLGLAGLADQGTRLLISFTNVPAGVSLFSSVSPIVSGGTDVVRRVSTDSVGSGSYLPISGNDFGIAPISLVGGSGIAAYEVIQSDPNTFATVNIPIYAAYDATSALPALGTAVIFANLGPLSSVTTADATAPVPRFASTASALNAFTITACTPSIDLNQHGLTGSWYEDATSGQGVEVEVFANPSSGTGSTFVSWFTYDTVVGGAERQRWYTAQGPVVTGQPTATLAIFQNTGGNFNAPPVTSAQQVGTATLSFNSCTSGQFTYSFTDGTNRTGTIPLTRLTQNVTCSTTTPHPTNADFALSGNWFGGVTTSGQGFTAEVNPVSGAFFSAWYTYMPSGASAGAAGQRWYTAQGSFAAGMRSIPVTILETTGGRFDTPTPPGQNTVAVGTGTMAFQSCSAATFSYTFTGGSSSGLSGTITLSRVGPVPPGCPS